jgi:hypothetical protein
MVTIDDDYNISCKAGEAFTLNFDFWSDDAHTVGINMTGKTVRFTAKRTKDNDPTDSKAAIKIDVVLSAPSPTNRCPIPFIGSGTNGTDILFGDYYYDVKVDSDDYYPISARFHVDQAVTKR